jgi:hypothetical protein
MRFSTLSMARRRSALLHKRSRGVVSAGVALALSLTVITPAGAQSAADCAARADRASRDTSGIAGGAMRGATRGALFGAIVGDSRKSARRGAAFGGIVGGARGNYRKNEIYKRVYDDCMFYGR